MTRLGSARFDINYEGGQFHAQGPGSGFADAKSGNGTRPQIGTCERCPRKLSSAGISHDLCHVEMQLIDYKLGRRSSFTDERGKPYFSMTI